MSLNRWYFYRGLGIENTTGVLRVVDKLEKIGESRVAELVSMQKLIILKVGSTLPILLDRRGDFEDWILAGLGGDFRTRSILDARNGSALPDPDELSGVVIAGSHSMVTERQPWSERLAAWLPGVVERQIPVLGICYGHQLLAYALGGEVGDNPNGREFGTIEVELNAGYDPLLGGFAPRLPVQVCHTQSVLRLPERARRLASSTRDANEAYAIGERAWGVQFHPEFDAEVVRAYIEAYQQVLRSEGQDPQALLEGTVETPCGTQILRRFANLVDKRKDD